MTATQPGRLDEWIDWFHDLYFPTQNLERSWVDIFAHVVEVAAAFNKAVFRKRDLDDAQRNLARLVAWFCALCDVIELRNVDHYVFEKYPLVCPYCVAAPCSCSARDSKGTIDWQDLETRSFNRRSERPDTLKRWQQHFYAIYPQGDLGGYEGLTEDQRSRQARLHLRIVMSRLHEELGEVSAAIRLRRYLTRNLAEEIADVVAWIAAAANCLNAALEVEAPADLEHIVWARYGSGCPTCNMSPCHCYIAVTRGLVETEDL